MCGINGIFAYHFAANPIDRSGLARTRDRMAARGPDGKGEWVATDERIGFGHRRLSIIDLSEAGSQPMVSADGKLTVTFNGEIYNYRELRQELERRGRVFRSQCDTEVLLHLFAVKGEDMVHDLRGMFAFAVWDDHAKRLFLARDPYGIKPLYYSDDGWTFRFASQVKALLAGGAISHDPEPAGVVGFYLWGSVPEPFTTYQAVRALPAGTVMSVDRIGAHEPKSYHAIAEIYRAAEESGGRPNLTNEDVQSAIGAALRDSVRYHLVADVPIGAFLSAGIDSGALVGLMRDVGQQDIQTVTLAFEEFRGKPEDEAPLAAKVASLYGTRHTTRLVTRTEFESDLPQLLENMDQPSIDGVNTWFVSKAAHELGLKIAVSGLGGDELFGGYPSFRDIPRWVRYAAIPSRVPGLGRVARLVGRHLTRLLGLNSKVTGMFELGGTFEGAYLLRRGVFMPWELTQVLDPDVVEAGLRRLSPLRRTATNRVDWPKCPHAKVAALESTLYMRNQLLRDTDWASMAHSLEVRVPLVDRVLLKTVAKLGSCAVAGRGKSVLANAPLRPLPAAVVARRKTGFTTPIRRWMQHQNPQRAARTLNRGDTNRWARDWGVSVKQFTDSGFPPEFKRSNASP